MFTVGSLIKNRISYYFFSEPNAFAPVLDMKDVDGKPVDVYKGFIVSDEDTVSLVPELKASDDDKIGGASKC